MEYEDLFGEQESVFTAISFNVNDLAE